MRLSEEVTLEFGGLLTKGTVRKGIPGRMNGTCKAVGHQCGLLWEHQMHPIKLDPPGSGESRDSRRRQIKTQEA